METSQFTNKSIILFILFIFIVSCSKKDKISPSEPKKDDPVAVAKGVMELSNTDVVGYQVVNIKIKDLVLDKSEYEVEVGGKKVKSIRNLDNSLDFMVPGDLSNGKYIVKLAVATNTVEISLTAPKMLPDPEKVFKEFIGNTDTKVAEITANLGLTTPPQYLTQAKQKLDDGLAKFNALSVADKQIATQILEANSKAINELSALLDQGRTLSVNRVLDKGTKSTMAIADCNVDCYIGHAVRILIAAELLATSSIAAPIFATVVAVDFLASIITGKRSFLLASTKAIISEVFEWAYYPQIKYAIGTIDKGFNNGITNMDVKLDLVVKGEPFNFKLKPVYRTMSRSDAANPLMPYATLFINAYDKLRAVYDKYFASEMGALSDFVVKEEKIPTKLLSDWEIKVVSNSNVTVSAPVGEPDNFSVEFDSKLKEDQEFQFTINLKGAMGAVSEKVIATLVEQDPFKMEIRNGGIQNGESNQKVGQLRVVVKDKNGMTRSGVKVDWTVIAGGGTLTQSPLTPNVQSITDDFGMAVADWTLGFAGEQTVHAVVKKRDGSYIMGAPLVFKAVIAYPDKIEKISSTDNQIGEAGKKLPLPLKVKVLDEMGLPLQGAKVKWVALHGGGKMNLNENVTDMNGIAEAELTAGPDVQQLVQATVVNKEGKVLQANFMVTLFDLVGKWKVESQIYRSYSGNGTLLEAYDDDDAEYLEFASNGKLIITFDGGDVETGSYTLDLTNEFIYITNPNADPVFSTGKYKISNQFGTVFTMTSDKAPVKDASRPAVSYEIEELKLKKQ